jgi:hypothetical protein
MVITLFMVWSFVVSLIDDKAAADAAGAQTVAARHAAAFAFQILAKFTLPAQDNPLSAAPQQIPQQMPTFTLYEQNRYHLNNSGKEKQHI